jgi:hypothetical protein
MIDSSLLRIRSALTGAPLTGHARKQLLLWKNYSPLVYQRPINLFYRSSASAEHDERVSRLKRPGNRN